MAPKKDDAAKQPQDQTAKSGQVQLSEALAANEALKRELTAARAMNADAMPFDALLNVCSRRLTGAEFRTTGGNLPGSFKAFARAFTEFLADDMTKRFLSEARARAAAKEA